MKKLTFLLFLLVGTVGIAQKEMPDVQLKNLDGKLISTKTGFNEKDKVYVFSFWATWCAPCIQELNAIGDVYEDWQDEIDVEIVAVSIDNSRSVSRVKPKVNGLGWEYTILLDTNNELKRKVGATNVPFIAVVKNGKILYTKNGHSPGSEDALFEKIKTL